MAPALVLVVLAPIVAEFLLADFTIRNLPVLLALVPLYGGGALLVREVARRTGRGWPTMLLLALAYAADRGSVPHPVALQSRLRPQAAARLRLPARGSARPSTGRFFVLSIHVVWSIATPILIAEGLAGGRGRTPWLKPIGIDRDGGASSSSGARPSRLFSWKASPFVASPTQFAVSAALVALALGDGASRRSPAWSAAAPPSPATAPSLAVVGASTLVLALRLPRQSNATRPAAASALRCRSSSGWPAKPCAGAPLEVGATPWLDAAALPGDRRGDDADLLPVRAERGDERPHQPRRAHDSVDVAGQAALGVPVFALIAWAARVRAPADDSVTRL